MRLGPFHLEVGLEEGFVQLGEQQVTVTNLVANPLEL